MQEKSVESMDSKELIHQFEQLRERASKDALTGLLNRGTTERYIKHRLKEMPKEESCAMMIIDLDHFKTVNDTLGHQAGDQVIRRSAHILSSLFRARDVVGRLGGDEFVIFLSGRITESVVRQKANAICQHLQLTMGEAQEIVVTASVGICISSGKDREFDDLYRMADASLYEAKRSGKNRFFINMDLDENFCQTQEDISVTPVKLDRIVDFADSGVALIEMDTPFKILYASTNFRKMLGIKEKGNNAPLFTTLIYREDWEVFDRMVLRAKLGEELNESIRVLKNQSELIWCRIRIKLSDLEEDVPSFMISLTNISELKEKEYQLKKENENLQMAFDQTGREMWELDFSTGIFRTNEDNVHFFVSGGVDFPEGLIGRGWVLPESVPAFREFARGLYDGKVSGYGNFALRYQDTGGYTWAGVSYNTIFNEDGQAVRAIGIVENLNQAVQEVQKKGLPKRSIPDSLMPHLVLSLKVNLSKGMVDKLWHEGKYVSDPNQWMRYDDVLEREKDRIIPKEDGDEFEHRFGRNSLMDTFYAGERWYVFEYRRTDGSGNIQWTQAVVNLYEDPDSQDIWAFICVSEAERRHKWEKVLGKDVTKDLTTEIYDRHTSHIMSEMIIKKVKGNYALVLMSIGGLARLFTDHVGNLDKKRFYIASAFRLVLGTECVIGQYNKNKLLFFFPRMQSEGMLKEYLEKSFLYVRSILSDIMPMEQLRFVAGAVWSGRKKMEYKSMLSQAIHLCDLWWSTPADTVAFSGEEEDMAWDEVQNKGEGDVLSPLMEKHQRPLVEKEKDVALECLSDLLASDSLEYSMQCLLGHIGEFYQADRTYILNLSENNHVITMPCEWTAPGKHSIQRTMSGIFIEKVPIIKRCYMERSPLLLVRNRKTYGLGMDSWRYAVFPMMEQDKVDSFLCVENGKANTSEPALPLMLIPYIMREKLKFQNGRFKGIGAAKGYYDDLPNLRSYMEVIYDFNSEMYSSLGTVCLDIPNLPSMNTTMGYEYGNQFLWYIAQTMESIFGNTLLFRTWEAEFVVLCPNINQQVFLGRCNRLWTLMQRRYPGKVRIGHTWAEGEFSGKTMVEEARVIMRSEHNNLWSQITEDTSKANIFRAKKAAREGKIVIFLQPKVNMLTGELVGAEVLSRGIDENGTIILPEAYMDDMEKRGDIRELDLHILDKTLFLMSQWKEEGMKLVPLSVNFSWVTLMDATALASVLAIYSRYPKECFELIEFEVRAEIDGELSPEKRKVLKQFREYNIRFILDRCVPYEIKSSAWNIPEISAVKLDENFVLEMSKMETKKKIAKEFIKNCRLAGITCMAEGVESRMQISELTQAGCFLGQGFYYDYPIPTEQFRKKYLYSIEAKSGVSGIKGDGKNV
ncbi:MAG: diguanylate cyclase [Eubacteriales bacterium]|nr:diguanylate cyclase [Eubacteriales bacterium]